MLGVTSAGSPLWNRISCSDFLGSSLTYYYSSLYHLLFRWLICPSASPLGLGSLRSVVSTKHDSRHRAGALVCVITVMKCCYCSFGVCVCDVWCAHTHMLLCSHRGQRRTPVILLHYSVPYSLETGSPLEAGAWLLVSKVPAVLLPLLSLTLWPQVHAWPLLDFLALAWVGLNSRARAADALPHWPLPGARGCTLGWAGLRKLTFSPYTLTSGMSSVQFEFQINKK